MDAMARRRAEMVDQQIAARGVEDARVLSAMRQVPRERFVPKNLRKHAFQDSPLPIGLDQTISQPYIVALMTEKLLLKATDRALEVGTGSGYAAAVMSMIAAEVYTIERHGRLALQAARRLTEMGFTNVQVEHGNGYQGWPEQAPFDAIMVSAGGTEVPPPLLEQLALGGRLVVPVGDTAHHQRLLRITRHSEAEYEEERLAYVAFVPLIDATAEEG